MATKQQPLGRSNPVALGTDEVGLFPYDGVVHSPADFVAQHAGLLARHEEALLRKQVDALACAKPPPIFSTCLARAHAGTAAAEPVLRARRSGGRSAFIPEGSRKLKGCRPVLDGATYPLEVLPFGATRITRTTIPFGTLTREAVLRELLGYAFMREHQLPVHARPVCVFEYRHAEKTPGYCLVLESRGEERIEAHIAYPTCSVAELVAAKRKGAATVGGTPLGAELLLRDVNLWWYIEAKAGLLCDLHFHGGFRGILNSNIGNDVLLRTAANKPELCLCDFDTFHVVSLPTIPTDNFLRAFALHAMIEVIKGSLSIFDCLEIPSGSAPEAIADHLGRLYFAKSSLWRAYARRFEQTAKALGWNPESTRAALAGAGRTAVAADVLASCIVNNHYLRTMDGDRQVYYPHN